MVLNYYCVCFKIDYPEIADGLTPRHRFMSAYEQRIEPPDKTWQYLLFAAEPYETVSFKVTQWRLLSFLKRAFPQEQARNKLDFIYPSKNQL